MNKAILCYVTDRRALPAIAGADPASALIQCIQQAARSGVDWVQLREKDLDARPLFDLATGAIAACAAASSAGKRARVLVNDRLDVAISAQAAGVHLGENSVPGAEVTRWRRRAGCPDLLVGASCHSPEGAAQAAANGVDYLFFGPVFDTPSKQAFGPPQGLEKLERVCRVVSLPVLAIGGITAENARACLEAGASGIAAIRLFQQAPERVAAVISQIRG